MKYLGVDFGTKRIGLAISDDAGNFAFPGQIILNKPGYVDVIAEIIRSNHIERVVVGESQNYDMQDNKVMADVRTFIADLESKIDVDIVLHSEVMTSMQVETMHHYISNDDTSRKKNTKAVQIDAQAAAIMLQSYIDSL